MHAHTHVRACTHVFAHASTHIRALRYTLMRVCVFYVCACTQMHSCMHAYTCALTHACTHAIPIMHRERERERERERKREKERERELTKVGRKRNTTPIRPPKYSRLALPPAHVQQHILLHILLHPFAPHRGVTTPPTTTPHPLYPQTHILAQILRKYYSHFTTPTRHIV